MGVDADLEREIEEIYMETKGAVASYLLYLGVTRPEAQELTQEVFFELYRTRRGGKRIESPRAWVFRVAHNLGLQQRKRTLEFRANAPNWERTAGTSAPSFEAQMIEDERRKRVESVLADLSPQQRHCLYLRAEGLRYREIAEVLNITVSTVNEFLRRATNRLAEAARG